MAYAVRYLSTVQSRRHPPRLHHILCMKAVRAMKMKHKPHFAFCMTWRWLGWFCASSSSTTASLPSTNSAKQNVLMWLSYFYFVLTWVFGRAFVRVDRSNGHSTARSWSNRFTKLIEMATFATKSKNQFDNWLWGEIRWSIQWVIESDGQSGARYSPAIRSDGMAWMSTISRWPFDNSISLEASLGNE